LFGDVDEDEFNIKGAKQPPQSKLGFLGDDDDDDDTFVP
jgi:hypothetical protein